MARVTIYEAVKQLQFKGLESFDCSKILGFISLFDEKNPTSRVRPVRGLVKMLYEIFIEQINYNVEETKGQPKLLFAFNEINGRPDSKEMLRQLYGCASDASLVVWRKSHSLIPLKEVGRNISFVFSWLSELKATGLTLGQKTTVVNRLLMVLNLQRKLKPFLNYNAVVVRYDAQTYDNIVCQIFQNNGRIAITAQHGVFVASREGSLFYGHEFRLSVSDYFMAWNNMTKQEAIKEGMDENRIRICGNARCINLECCKNKNNGVMGVLLDGWGFGYNNKALIQIANDYCKKHNYKYILRYHPSAKGDEYSDIISNDYYIGNNRESMDEYANKVEFSIMGGSAALLELLYIKHPTYVYSTKAASDIYCQYIDVFQDLTSLEELIGKKEYSDEVFKELVTIHDAKSSYTAFFSMVTQER